MSNPNMEARVKELMELKRMKEELEAEITAMEDEADLPAVFIKCYPRYAEGMMNVSELARVCGLSRPTVYKYIKMVG